MRGQDQVTGTATSEWPLWSTTARIVVTDPAALTEATTIADALLADVDAACSRFRSDSELSRISPYLSAGVEVSDLLGGLVRDALDAAAWTRGDVDPTLGYALDAVGYDRDIELLVTDDRLVRAVISPRPGWKSVSLLGNRLTVPSYLALDLGATAKAGAADLVAAGISSELGCGVLVSLGGDIATSGAAPATGWNVRVEDLPGDPASVVLLSAGHALATSSTQKRTWQRGGALRHHILDPRTGLSAPTVWRTVTVADETCLTANALSTASIVRGFAAPAWLDSLGIAARFVAEDGSVTTVGGWPAEHAAPRLERSAA